MNIFWNAAAALAIAAATASAADAALVTNTYSVVSTFDKGPNASITQKFVLTFDPASHTTATVTDYSSSAEGATSVVGTAYRYFSPSSSDINSVMFNWAKNGVTIGKDAPGYSLNLKFDPAGAVKSSYLFYSEGGNSFSSISSIASIVTAPISPGSGGPTPEAPVAAAVPEPATWAMMILGFGVVGGAMRRRRTTLRYA